MMRARPCAPPPARTAVSDDLRRPWLASPVASRLLCPRVGMRTIAILSALALAACADISPNLPGGESGDGPDFGGDPDQGGNPGGGGGDDTGGGGGDDTGGDPDEQIGSPDGGMPAGDPDAAPVETPTVTLDSFADGDADGWTVYG